MAHPLNLKNLSTKCALAASLGLAMLSSSPVGHAQESQGRGDQQRMQPQQPPAPGSIYSTVAFTTSMEVLNDTAKLGAGDRVSFRVVEDRRDPIGLIVTDSGEMEVPLIGRVTALNKTCKQLAYELRPLLEKEYFYRATVILGLDMLSTKSRGKVYLTGQLRQQGAMELMPDETLTVSKAILRAGGLADFANKRKIKLVRRKADGQTETQIVDLVQIIDKGHLEKDPVLEPGDLVVVTERLINF